MRYVLRSRPTIRLPRRRRRSGLARGGFTLLEVAIAIVVIAMGVVAVQGLVGATTSVTAVTNELQTATMLGNAMHERCLGLDRAALLALHRKSYSPPLDSQAQPLTEFTGYAQRVEVDYVSPRAVSLTSNVETDLLRVSVTVSRQGRVVHTSHRLIATTKQD